MKSEFKQVKFDLKNALIKQKDLQKGCQDKLEHQAREYQAQFQALKATVISLNKQKEKREEDVQTLFSKVKEYKEMYLGLKELSEDHDAEIEMLQTLTKQQQDEIALLRSQAEQERDDHDSEVLSMQES